MHTSLEQMQAAGFPMGGEPLTALNLVDTLVTVTDPPTDLIIDPDRYQRWWELVEGPHLAAGPRPEPVAARRLRRVVRSLFDAYIGDEPPNPIVVEELNATAASVPMSPHLDGWRDAAHIHTRWHDDFGGNAVLAAIAGEAIDLLADPARRALLRRCANPQCSMLFLAANTRRIWCTANVCGNRARVARHLQRNHTHTTPD